MDKRRTQFSYLEKYIGETGPVIVKKYKKLDKSSVVYVAIALDKTEIEELKETRTFNQRVHDLLISKELLPVTAHNISIDFIGDLRNFTSYENLVYRFPLRYREDPVYRNYVQTIERQKAMYGSINVCNTARKSWESVILKVGKNNGMLIKITTEYNDSTL